MKTRWEPEAIILVEPLDFLAKDNPVELTAYGKNYNLIEKESRKLFKRIARREKHLQRIEKQGKLRSFRMSPPYMYGYTKPLRTTRKYLALVRETRTTSGKSCELLGA